MVVGQNPVKPRQINGRIVIKSLLCHVAILFFTVFLSSQAIAISNGHIALEVIHFAIVTCLYIGSGYVIARSEIDKRGLSFFSVFFLGFIFWTAAFVNSPNDLNWKFGEGGAWLFYRLYVSSYDVVLGKLARFDGVQTNMALLLTFSILPSTLMAIGKIVRKRKALHSITQPSA